MSADEILENANSVREFLRNGGITATGGEPLMQLDFLTELFRKAKTQYDFHTCLDTSGVCFTNKKEAEYRELIKYTDLVMLDIKHIDPQEHEKLTAQKIAPNTNKSVTLQMSQNITNIPKIINAFTSTSALIVFVSIGCLRTIFKIFCTAIIIEPPIII